MLMEAWRGFVHTRGAHARLASIQRMYSAARPYATDSGMTLREAVEGKASPTPVAEENKRQQRFKQYEEKLKAKARQEGLSGVDELKAKHEEKQEQLREKQKAAFDSARAEQINAQVKSEAERTASVEGRDETMRERLRMQRQQDEQRKLSGEADPASPIKPLSSFVDVEKLAQEPTETVGKLWTGYHTMHEKLSAVIPKDTYEAILETAQKYPMFILPLPRTEPGSGDQKTAFEMYLLQWTMLPRSASTPPDAPQPSALLFAPLAEYKLRQEFAQPALILSHYTDVADSKGVVLMRGDITGRRGDDSTEGAPLISQQDAQLLAMSMQRFYRAEPGEAGEQRTALLKKFHDDPSNFELDKLLDLTFRL